VDPVVALAAFPIIFVGELPDKTMLASLVLATRGSPLAVWLGAAAAFAVHVAIAVTVGAAVERLLPHRLTEALVAAVFALGAAVALWPRRNEDDRGAGDAVPGPADEVTAVQPGEVEAVACSAPLPSSSWPSGVTSPRC
jgi:uncharacterized protein YqfA (UPF0365 family)